MPGGLTWRSISSCHPKTLHSLADLDRYGAQAEDFAEIARISHEHSTHNPYAQFKKAYTLQEILDSPMIHAPLTKLQCSPTSDGAGAAVIVSERFLEQRPWLKKQAMMTDTPSTYSRDAIDLVGYDMTARASAAALHEANASAKDVGVCELHDCFSTNQMVLLDGLGFSEKGKAHLMVRNGDITHGGNGPLINPSGGLISKGHPLGATGLAQCCELTWQLRGWANTRFVPAEVALQHNLGLGGCVVVNVYRRADGQKSVLVDDADIIASTGWTYNPATAARTIRLEDAAKVESRKFKVEYAQGNTPEKIQSRL
jgi:sterol carrier protein 2